MKILKARPITRGAASGEALVTKTPINFTAAHTKYRNVFHLSTLQDPHHDLFGKRVEGKILVFPTCIGSTYTGVVLLELMFRKVAPRALIVENADPLLVSGPVLADVWFDCGIPVLEYREPDLFSLIHTGDKVSVDANTGKITVG